MRDYFLEIKNGIESNINTATAGAVSVYYDNPDNFSDNQSKEDFILINLINVVETPQLGNIVRYRPRYEVVYFPAELKDLEPDKLTSISMSLSQCMDVIRLVRYESDGMRVSDVTKHARDKSVQIVDGIIHVYAQYEFDLAPIDTVEIVQNYDVNIKVNKE